ncbi:MAG: PEGA domain-containing protein [Calditrichaeota bacterium]|nr:PEGA domain-containing protein [Calditrichota bacterium]MCB9368761.1 PEGA domain-containing protein [Calditrichota bacterium]
MIVTSDTVNPVARRRALIRILVAIVLMLAAIAMGVLSWLRDESAVLIVTSAPKGAEVVLNFRPSGVMTNAYISDLPADSFAVSLRQDGFRPFPFVQWIRLQSGDTTRVNFFMRPIARGDERELPRADGAPHKWQWKTVAINSDPPGAEVIIDDVPTGLLTPANFVFDRGLHHLQANWPNGAKSFKNVIIEPSTTQPNILFRPATYIQPDK